MDTSVVTVQTGSLSGHRAIRAAAVILTVAVLAVSSVDGASALTVAAGCVWVAAGAVVLLRGNAPQPIGVTLLANGISQPLLQVTGGTPDAWVGRAVLAVALTLVVWTLSTFPDGRFRPAWLLGFTAAYAAWELATVIVTSSSAAWDAVGGAVFFAGVLVPIGAQVRRYRRESDPVLRTRTKWVVYGTAVAMLGELVVSLPYFGSAWWPDLVASGSGYAQFQSVASTLLITVIPVAVAVAVVRHNLYDIDVVISRSLVFGGLTVLVVTTYAAVVGGLALVVSDRGDRLAPLAGAAVVALVFGPSRSWLQRRVRRLVYGLRAEPYAAISGLGQRLAGSIAEEDVPAALVTTVRAALRAPYVAVHLADGVTFPVAAESGAPSDERLTIPLLHGGDQVGMLVVGHDAAHPLTGPDRALLDDLAAQAGGAVRALLLTDNLRRSAADLQAARELLVLAREEERRRLRRDLHDGLAPTIAAAGIVAATAAEVTAGQQTELLARLQQMLVSAGTDVRRIVDGLRPVALDELGLVGAVEERARDLHDGVRVEVRVEQLPTLPAAVEVAAYRICEEALVNVLRHARASSVEVVLEPQDDGLRVVVEDDGCGVDPVAVAGVGLASMKQRAAEVGGRATVTPRQDGGTRVEVWLPVREPA